ncbi:MAG: hypothetical protein LBS18_04855 [Clostridiales bacterium]|nr:hypothetical protein [Clostridiales bacterium]
MPFCKVCGTPYLKTDGACPTCNALSLLRQQSRQEPGMAPEKLSRERKKSWLGLALGIPLFIIFIYAMLHIMSALKPA